MTLTPLDTCHGTAAARLPIPAEVAALVGEFGLAWMLAERDPAFDPVGACVGLHHQFVARDGRGASESVRQLRDLGATRRELADLVALAWLHGGPAAMSVAVVTLEPELPAWPDDTIGITWPRGWRADRLAFRSGVNFAATGGEENGIAPADLQRIEQWHLRVQGEVPQYVRFFAAYHPLTLKAQRARYETLVTGVLPPQLVAVAHIHLAAARGHVGGLRRALHMARYFGVEAGVVHGVLALAQQHPGRTS